MPRTLRDLVKNLYGGLRLSLLRRVSLDAFAVSPEQLLLLLLVYLLACLAEDAANAGLRGHFDPAALPYVLFPPLLLILGGHLAARFQHDSRVALGLPVVLLATTPPITAVSMLATTAENVTLWYAALVWTIAVTIAAVLALVGWRPIRVLAIVLLIFALTLPPQIWLPQPGLWVAAEEDGATPSIAREEVFHAQPVLLEQQLKNLLPQRPGVVDLYFVGFGGTAGQDVFMREVRAVQSLFERRFDAAGRTVSLINNSRSAENTPIATATYLDRVLKRIGEIIDPEEDIVLLFVTSHGSQSHELAVSFEPLELRQLSARGIKQALDAHGIKWRVIVISACYSGGFIEPLRDDHSLIITAADATHASFGCSNEEDYTYFGRAYFGQQLQATLSFTEAFAAAGRTVAEWERERGFEPSRPQMHVGATIEKKLGALEHRLGELGIAPGVKVGGPKETK